jgi:hypothetical protein
VEASVSQENLRLNPCFNSPAKTANIEAQEPKRDLLADGFLCESLISELTRTRCAVHGVALNWATDGIVTLLLTDHPAPQEIAHFGRFLSSSGEHRPPSRVRGVTASDFVIRLGK